jgi:receptor protein-tyrosine kinase
VLLGLLIGLTLGLVAAFARDSLDRRFKNTREIADDLHLPILGAVPEELLGRALVGKSRRRTFSDADLEGFRIIRTNLEFLDGERPPKLVVVTSALPQEGKSTVSAALAAAYATAGQRTLLVECDLRRPRLAARLGLDPTPGLSDYLRGNSKPGDVVQTLVPPSGASDGATASVEGGAAQLPLVAIAAGSQSSNPAELLRSQRCRDFFEQVKQAYDIVIIDSPPILSVADTLEILPLSDAVVVCVRASQTRREQARAAKGALSHLPERPAGVVITGIRSAEEGTYYGFYSYGEVYGASAR